MKLLNDSYYHIICPRQELWILNKSIMKKTAMSSHHVLTKYQENDVTRQIHLHQVLSGQMHGDGYGANSTYFCQK